MSDDTKITETLENNSINEVVKGKNNLNKDKDVKENQNEPNDFMRTLSLEKEKYLLNLKKEGKFVDEDEIKLKKEEYEKFLKEIENLKSEKDKKLSLDEETKSKIKAIEEAHNNKLSAKEKMIKDLADKYEKNKEMLRRDKIERAITESANKYRVKHEYLDMIIEHLSKRIDFGDKENFKQIICLDQEGQIIFNEKGTYLSVDELIKKFIEEKPAFFEPNLKSGIGIENYVDFGNKSFNPTRLTQDQIHKIYSNEEEYKKFKASFKRK